MSATLVVSPHARDRREAALHHLAGIEADAPVVIVAPTIEVAGELLRDALPEAGARFGASPTTLPRLAATLAAPELARQGLSPASALSLDAVMASVVHDLAARGELGRFGLVGELPGLPVALARTIQELRLAEADPSSVDPDLARIARAFEDALAAARLVDRARLFRLASVDTPLDAHLIVLDVAVEHRAEAAFLQHTTRAARSVFASAPAADERSVRRLEHALCVAPTRLDPTRTTSVARAASGLFAEHVEVGDDDGSVVVLSAPGDDREAVEITRRIHREAARGVPFDRMAVLVRSPSPHRAHLAAALRRAGIPAHLSLGVRLPDPSGRALLALLACRLEDCSARRFAEYMSLGELPHLEDGAPAPPSPLHEASYVAPDDEALPRTDDAEPPVTDDVAPPRAPHRWERLLVASAVLHGAARWRARLAHRRERLEDLAARADHEESGRLLAERDELTALERFALPLIEELERLPQRAPWGTWKLALERLANRALASPERVRSVLSELSPMAGVGPVSLTEVRDVLAPRLTDLHHKPDARRAGAVLVGTTDAVRGRALDVVFVAGLAERIFPQKLTEDPVLSDEARRACSVELAVQADRAATERLALALAVGAATERLYVSFSRIDTEQRRQRTPSFYALEVLRAVTGRLPSFDELERRAQAECDARLAWPAPTDRAQAIDVTEYDLATLRQLEGRPTAEKVGLARYLLLESRHLARALRGRVARGLSGFTPEDGLFRPSEAAKAALAPHQVEARSFSPTALQSYAACPYRFYLYTVLRLRPRETAERLDELDALLRGSFTHEALFRLHVRLRDAGLLPIDERTHAAAVERLEEVLVEVERVYRERHDPAVRRVWDDGIQSIRADLHEWLRRKILEPDLVPTHFELAFGLTEEEPGARDAASVDAALPLSVGITLRGSIDLVERGPKGLVATDYKTGKQRAQADCIIGKGEILQPVFYALVLEALFPGEAIDGGRLAYATFAGDFHVVRVPFDETARAAAKLVADTVGGALREGSFPAKPREGACTYCDYLAVCGGGEERRTRGKPLIAPLERLRAHR